MTHLYIGDWRRLALRGAAAILFGFATLAWPGLTLWALVVLWGAYAFVDGVLALSTAISVPILAHRGWLALHGIAGIAAGTVTFAWPSITALTLLYVIAAWAFIVGAELIATAIRMRREATGGWALAIAGGVSALLGVVLVSAPGAGALGITWAIGWSVITFGSLQLGLAFSLRRATTQLAKSDRLAGSNRPRLAA
jgi:uncharacterized membrane protein HdeD (DUF308 family)